MGKVGIGSKIKPGDVGDLMEWLERRVGKRSKEPLDMVWLPLVAAELGIMLARKNWHYNEDMEQSIVSIRLSAQSIAKGIFESSGVDEHD